MKKILFPLCFMLLVFTPSTALPLSKIPSLGLSFHQGNSSSIGTIGLTSSLFDVQFGFSTQSDDASSKTEITTFALKCGLKTSLNNITYVEYGVVYEPISGKYYGVDFDSWSSIGFYVGLQHQLTENFLLDAMYIPFSSTSTKVNDITTTTTVLGGNTLFGVTYLFDLN